MHSSTWLPRHLCFSSLLFSYACPNKCSYTVCVYVIFFSKCVFPFLCLLTFRSLYLFCSYVDNLDFIFQGDTWLPIDLLSLLATIFSSFHLATCLLNEDVQVRLNQRCCQMSNLFSRTRIGIIFNLPSLILSVTFQVKT